MRKALLLLILVFLASCSTQTTKEPIVQEDNSLEEERKALEDVAKEFLEESKNEQKENDETVKIKIDNTNDNQDFTVTSSVTEEKEEEVEEKEEISSEIDIRIRSVDIDFPSSFDLEDDSVEVDVNIETQGLKKNQFFVVEVFALHKGEEFSNCQFVYIVDNIETDTSCEMDNFERDGEFDAIIVVDSRNKFDEIDETNNEEREEFEIEE